ncbi:MAG: T9SS C-terminal target domain-containing protein [Ignavibacteriales bacterium]|nr:MAG: T9SS C-terminal target domain-containing protein [Ignavibacteriales bacterium]
MNKILFVIILITSFKTNAQVWQVIEGTEMPVPVYGGEAVVVDSLIYILGGFSDSLNISVNIIQEYNPLTNSWRIIDSMNASRYGFVAGNYQDSIFITGGIDLNLSLDSSLEIWNLINQPYIFDLKLDFIRTFAAGIINNNTLYVFGGLLVNPLSTYMFGYNISDSTFSIRENFGFIAVYPFQQMAAYANNSIYLFGGVFIATSRAIYQYDILNEELTLLPTELTQSRSGGKAISLNDSLIYVIGGFNETSFSLSGVEEFRVDSGGYTVSAGPALNFERSELMAVKFNNSIYVFGGKDDSGKPVKKVEKLDFVTGIKNENSTSPEDFYLNQNYPNPFNPSTNISFSLSSKSLVKIEIYNLAGEEVIELVNKEMDEGIHNIIFDASAGDLTLTSGVYFYRLVAFNFSTQKTYIATRKMLLLK